MRIGFDGKRAVQNFTGLGNYSRYIVDILCQFYPENEYVLYAPKKRENKRLDKLTKQYQQLQLSYPTTSSWKKLSSLWRVWGVTQQLEKEKILNNITLGTFADSNDFIGIFTGFTEFVCVYFPVDRMVILRIAQKDQIVNRYNTFYLALMYIQG